MREKINFMREVAEVLMFLEKCLMLVSLYHCAMYLYLTTDYMPHYNAMMRSLIALAVVSAAFLLFYGGLAYLEHKFWPQPLDNAIKSNHGKHLTAVMKRLRTESIEYRAMFNVKERKVAEGTLSSPNICNIPKEEWSRIYQAGLIDLHNHPDVEQTSFSDQDLYSMIHLKTRRDIVVTRSFTYIMENPYWNRDDGPDAEVVKEYAAHLYGCSKGHYNFRIVSMVLFTRLHSWYVSYKTAKKFGLKYRIESLRFQWFKAVCKLVLATPERFVIASLITAVVIANLPHIGLSVTNHQTESNIDTHHTSADLANLIALSRRYSLSVNAENAARPQYKVTVRHVDASNGQILDTDDTLIAEKSNPADGAFQPDAPVRVDVID